MRYTLFFLLLTTTLNFSYSQSEKPFIKEIKSFRKADKENPPEEDCVLFVGSSSIRGWTDLESDFSHYNVVNRGFGGSTFKDAIMYAEDLVLKHKPSAVFIYEGDNDISNGTSIEEIMADAQRFTQIIREKYPNVAIVFISPKPSIARWNLHEKYERLNADLQEWAGHEPKTFFIDVWEHMLDTKGEPMKDIFLEDNLHMNDKGYAIWKKDIGGFLSMVVPN